MSKTQNYCYEYTEKDLRNLDHEIYELCFDGQDLGYLEDGKLTVPYFSKDFEGLRILLNEIESRNLRLRINSNSIGYSVNIDGHKCNSNELTKAIAVAFKYYLRWGEE